MPEEQKEEPQEQQPEEPQNEGAQSNGAPSPEDLEAIRAQLEEEKKAKAEAQEEIERLETTLVDAQTRLEEFEQALAERDAKIAELQSKLATLPNIQTELEAAQADYRNAVSKYLEAVRAANPTIPGDVISGSTIDEIDASLQKALTIAESVKKSLEAEAQETKVPAGAPPRTGPPLESLSPREKIIAGIQQKGGP